MDGECDDMCRTVHDLKKSFDRIFDLQRVG